MTFQSRLILGVLELFIVPILAVGQVSVDVHATAGLDEATRRLLERYPKEVHDQVLAIIQDAMPVLQENVDKFLDKVNVKAERLIVDIKCASIGVLSASARANPLDIPFSTPPSAIKELRQIAAREIGHLSRYSGPHDYYDTYSDLSNKAGTIYCEELNISDPSDAAESRVQYEQLGIMWRRLVPYCKNARNCVKMQHESAQKLVKHSDERDLQSSQARETLAKVSYPTDPSIFESFNPAPYENTLGQLLNIQDGLVWYQARREYMAAKLVGDAKKQLSSIDDEIRTGLALIQPIQWFACTHIVDWLGAQKAVQGGNRAEATSVEIDKMLSQAVALDAVNQTKNADNLRAELSQKHTDIETLKSAKAIQTVDPGECHGVAH
jgi:hypothetical protein